jgi:hypothetical protein
MKKKASNEIAAKKAYLQEPPSSAAATTKKPDLVISVPCSEDGAPTFVLEPPGRGGFRIVARCQEDRRAESPKPRSWSTHFAAVVRMVLSKITHCSAKRQRDSCHDV